jgi:MYXO-CTERM domain-containing protein
MRVLSTVVSLTLALAPLTQASGAAKDPWDAADAAQVPDENDGYPWGLLGLLGLLGLVRGRSRRS